MPTKIAAGNWKMNGLQTDMLELQLISKAAEQMDCRTIICPPTTLLGNATKFSKEIFIGGQDCHPEPSGAYTGDISANMLADTGASYVLVGHSERRSYHGENSKIVRAKAEAAIAATLKPVICVGENLQQRKSGDAIETVSSQIKDSVPANSEIILAYEPIWAIGTGVIPSFKEICQMHDTIRALLIKNYGSIG